MELNKPLPKEAVVQAVEAFNKLKPEQIAQLKAMVPHIEGNTLVNLAILISTMSVYVELFQLFPHLAFDPYLISLTEQRFIVLIALLPEQVRDKLSNNSFQEELNIFYKNEPAIQEDFNDLTHIELNEI